MTGDGLFELAYAQLRPVAGRSAPTSAGDRVRRPGDLPSQRDQYPLIEMRLVGEGKQSQGRGSIGFLTTPTIRIIGKVSAPAHADDPLTSNVEQRLWALKREIERGIIGSYPLFAHVQQLVSVSTTLAYTVEGTHLAGIQSDYTFEIFESAEDFAPFDVDELDEIVASDPNHLPVQIRVPLNP